MFEEEVAEATVANLSKKIALAKQDSDDAAEATLESAIIDASVGIIALVNNRNLSKERRNELIAQLTDLHSEAFMVLRELETKARNAISMGRG